MRRGKLWLAGVLALGVAAGFACAATDYNITGIAPISGDVFSTALGINNNGEVVGESYNATFPPASGGPTPAPTVTAASGFFYTGGTTTVIPSFGTDTQGLSFAAPTAVNDSGEIIGAATLTGSNSLVGFTDIGGVVTNTTSLFGVPLALNNSGEVVAGGQNASGLVRYNGTAQTLNGLTTSPEVLAYSINDSGVVAGASATSASTKSALSIHLVEWPANSATPTDLGGLADFAVTVPFAINSSGDAVGGGVNPNSTSSSLDINPTSQNGSVALGLPNSLFSTYQGGFFISSEAFLYSAKSNKVTGLGDLGGGFSVAEAINSSDDVVGMSLDASGDYHAFLYNGTAMVDLNSLLPTDSGWDLINADGINNAGDIVGYGDDDGVFEAFVLTPSGTISGSGGESGSGNTSGGSTSGAAVPLPPAICSGMIMLVGLCVIEGVRLQRLGRLRRS